jgi:adenylate cyclase
MMKESYPASFQLAFSRQLLKNERFRALILSGVFVFLLLAAGFNYIFFNDFFERVFKNADAILWIILIGAFILLRSILISIVLAKRLETNKKDLPVLRYTNSILEISIPTIIIIIFAESSGSRISFITPATFLYFIFIFLSVLELDLKISTYTGIIGGLQYFLVTYYYHHTFPLSTDTIILNNQVYFSVIALILVITGISSGLIANEIKKRIMESLKSLEERNRIKHLFGQQVSPRIVDEIVSSSEELRSKKRSVCVMSLDIRDFSVFCDGKSPREIIHYQNTLFPFMIDIIYSHEGVINQFMGDGFMASFGVPVEHDYDCRNAVTSAMKIFNEVKRKSELGEIPYTKIGIGLHYGDVVTGNIGTESRMQYSITGNTVILAARLEQLNKNFDSSVLISREVWNKIDRDGLNIENFGAVDVKGRSEPVEIFKLA